ncbi:bifunctional serine/threonine-protein kinase/ABC transporter substrate-binding protein [Streptomyces sp. SCSIO ZS0520]|uniref:bifunctional serine/threonine-protein kinase/ABC transporter substrate-binding protein n=1 Tax=Streptomyces sp. SCSIO ZS0520 TaxID=2892996 RepID=UPI0021D86E57|nr:bifunctional serine/threonine-protein kinase/ABC transporter substrate-binding protein [Streptomyces sp. SCSIO ZS0520]
MRALRHQDPEEVGGHRLLARLGAGGMGVVYLARAGGGALVALKVIRAEYAADPDFRARFRREAGLAGRLSGRWTVPVRAADAEAAEPWLATDFVPGPSLAEAVAGYGPLPAPAVLGLGARLAEALAEVHAAGLVHRDVKPGNVLLTRDGPRLIDFGIARGGGTTALTAADAVIGTPGYLSPEQTRMHGGEVGPASDLFSLGCVLAHAATGRAPFGGGDAVAVLYRTLHEAPDLDGLGRLPPAARALIEGCLSREPGARPTAERLCAALAALGGTADPRGQGGWGAVAPGPGDDWLPPALLRLVAERAARALDPPPRLAAPEGAPADPEPTTAEVAPAGPARRRFLVVGGAAAAVLAAGGACAAVLAARGSSSAADGRPVHLLGLHAESTGGLGATGRALEHGARLAVEAHNARADSPFRLALKRVGDGSAARARAGAEALLAGDPPVAAVLGLATAEALKAAAPLYDRAGTAMVLVSYDGGAVSPTEQRTLCVTRATGAMAAIPLLSYLTRVREVSRTAVVQDLSGGAAAEQLARDLRESPPSEGTTHVHQIRADQRDFGAVTAAALADRPGAVVYAGVSPERAAALARELAAAGWSGVRAATEPVLRPAFLDAAGEAARDWVIAAPYTDAAAGLTAAAREFGAAHRKRYGGPPPRWSAEAYDAVGLLAQGLGRLDGSRVAPRALADTLFGLSHRGVAKTLSFAADNTRTLTWKNTGFLYQVREGAFRFLGRYDQVRG